MKGTIALDIDGTITVEHHSMPDKVIEFLDKLVHKGWNIVFITGRTFAWGYSVLQALPFEYFYAVQNGAIILKMPSRTILSKKYLDRSIFPIMDAICLGEASDYVLFSGFEENDQCFYRPERFSDSLLQFLEKRIAALKENWKPVKTFDEVSIREFPSVKCFGLLDSAMRIAKKIEEKAGLHVPLIRDPFDPQYFVAQATHADVNKGEALRDVLRLSQAKGVVIAAGDDVNDLTMLEAADIKVAMQNAPQNLLAIADVIAPPASEFGIIEGLSRAIDLAQHFPKQTSQNKIG